MTGVAQVHAAPPCEVHWSDEFLSAELAEGGVVHMLQALDDGAGAPALYVGGEFLRAGLDQDPSGDALLRFDGMSWSFPPGGPITDNEYLAVYTMTLHDDGASLYVGGSFDFAGSVISTRTRTSTPTISRCCWTRGGRARQDFDASGTVGAPTC